ncbi:MAG: HEPN domain-containing protein [Candidatus Thermoplasmatota archaeon]|nr:HEPN domain-containing protein [Candidatus Thermoplasmatota archaeon]
MQAIADLVAQEVDDHTFAVPLLGIELAGVDSFALGAVTILRMSVDVLNSAGVKHDHADVPHLLELNKHYLWLIGSTRGTPSAAQKRFSEQATLAVGMLAITAASMHEWGASTFRIGIVMTPEEATGRSVWFSWHERGRGLITHYAFPSGQLFPVNTALGDESDMVRMIFHAFAILQASDRTQLEDAIARAVYWYSDAHRDPVLVMKLVKYWSCVEAFFSFEKDEVITHAVAAGLASILVFGGFQFVPPSGYSALKKQIVDLYSLRSRAVHQGSHQHTTEHQIAQFSQWVAWMIINMVGLVEQGYTTLKEVKAQTDRLDGLEERKGKK